MKPGLIHHAVAVLTGCKKTWQQQVQSNHRSQETHLQPVNWLKSNEDLSAKVILCWQGSHVHVLFTITEYFICASVVCLKIQTSLVHHRIPHGTAEFCSYAIWTRNDHRGIIGPSETVIWCCFACIVPQQIMCCHWFKNEWMLQCYAPVFGFWISTRGTIDSWSPRS